MCVLLLSHTKEQVCRQYPTQMLQSINILSTYDNNNNNNNQQEFATQRQARSLQADRT